MYCTCTCNYCGDIVLTYTVQDITTHIYIYVYVYSCIYIYICTCICILYIHLYNISTIVHIHTLNLFFGQARDPFSIVSRTNLEEKGGVLPFSTQPAKYDIT